MKELDNTNKLVVLLDELGIKAIRIAKACDVSRPNLYQWLKNGVPEKYTRILDILIQEYRIQPRPAFIFPPRYEGDGTFVNPFTHLIKEMKFTPEEVSRETGYDEITCLNYSFRSAKVPEFTKEKMHGIMRKFAELRDKEKRVDLLDLWCETHGFKKVPINVDVNITMLYDPINDPVPVNDPFAA